MVELISIRELFIFNPKSLTMFKGSLTFMSVNCLNLRESKMEEFHGHGLNEKPDFQR